MRDKLVKLFNHDLLCFLLTILPGYYSLCLTIVIIGYVGNIAVQWIGPLLLYILAIVYFFAYVKNKYVNPISKKGMIAFEIVVIVLKVIGVVFTAMNMSWYITSFKYHTLSYIFPIDLLLLLILYVGIDIVLITGNKNRVYKDRVKHSKKFGFAVVLSGVFGVLLFYSTFSYILGFNSLAILKTEYALGFILVAFLCIVPLFSTFASYMRFRNGKFALMQKISISLSIVLVAFLMIYQMIDPDFMINSAKMFLPLDFIGSLALGPIWLSFLNLFPIVFLLGQNNINKK